MNVDTVPRTLFVAAAVALVCSTMVSVAVDQLRPKQVGFETLQRYRAVVTAAGLVDSEASDRDVAAAVDLLDVRAVDLDAGWYADDVDARALDHWSTGGADEGDEDGAAPRLVPIYVVASNADAAAIVLPVEGPGMWATIYGYVGLDADYNTVRHVVFHRHGETPGIGDRIQDPAWLDAWRGKRVRDADGAAAFRVVNDASGPFEVDSLTGATITSEAAGDLVRQWVGTGGYGPFLTRLAAAGSGL